MPDIKPKVFQVDIPAKLRPEHHLFWEVEYTILQVFIVATHDEDAARRSWVMAQSLNYEVTTGPFKVFEVLDPLPPEASHLLRIHSFIAKTAGVSFNLQHAEIGSPLPEGLKAG